MIQKTCYIKQNYCSRLQQVHDPGAGQTRHQSPELSLADSCLLEDKVQKAKLTSAYLEELWAVVSNAAALQASLSVLA